MRPVASLRTALLYPLLWLWLIPSVVATLAAFWFAGAATETSFDRVLKDDALALAAQVHWDKDGPSFKADSATAASLVFDSLSPSRFIVLTESGKTLIGNAELVLPLSSRSSKIKKGEPIFFDTITTWGILRTVALRLEHASSSEIVWVLVGEATSKREQVSHELAVAIFLPAAAVGFVIVPFLFLGIRHGLAPAREISDAVARRSIDDLSPLPIDEIPDELKGLILKINDLLYRLGESVAHERRFIAEAAHQLRTPAAGIKLLAEDLLTTHHNEPRRPPDSEVLEELAAAAGRASNVVQQLLAMARADSPVVASDLADVDLVALVKNTAQRWEKAVTLAQKTLTMTDALTSSPPLWLKLRSTLVEEALGNVIENAILYGGSAITVAFESTPSNIYLHVADNGSPLDAEDVSQIFMPFWRNPTSEAKGSGLGLAIAQKAMRNLGGDLSVRSGADVPGTCFTFRIPQRSAEN